MSLPAHNRDSRLMLIAPHPDDETLACGIILQKAVRAGAAVRVVYATDGDNNPWPQRVLERKWRIGEADRKRWGKLRRQEALAALRVLGVESGDVSFLGLPDQGLTDLLMHDCRSTLGVFEKLINDWAPTDLLIPSTADVHPDHSALAVMFGLALRDLSPPRANMSIWNFAVHGASPSFFGRATKIPESESETETKLAALACHKSQLKLSRRRFLSYATRSESFLRLARSPAVRAEGPLRIISRDSDALCLNLKLSPKPLAKNRPRIFLLGHNPSGDLLSLTMPVPLRSGAVEISDYVTGRQIGIAQFRGNQFRGLILTIPPSLFSNADPLFVKLDRRSLFFDEAGWLEVAAPTQARPHPTPERETEALAIR